MKKWLVAFIILVIGVALCAGMAYADGEGPQESEPPAFTLSWPDNQSPLMDGDYAYGQFYYKIYVDNLPTGCDSLYLGWNEDTEATGPYNNEWELRQLETEKDGRQYIFIIPELEGNYDEELMFARTDLNEGTPVRYIHIEYERAPSLAESAKPVINTTTPPMQNQQDYVLQWSAVEGTEFYQIIWQKPDQTDGDSMQYWNHDPYLNLGQVWGEPTSETGEYRVRVFAFAGGRLLQASEPWTFQIAPDYYEAFGVDEVYDRSKDTEIAVTIPVAQNYPWINGHTYALTLWKNVNGEYAYTNQQWTAGTGETEANATLDPGEAISIALKNGQTTGLEDGLYFLRVKEYEDATQVDQFDQFDIYFAVVNGLPSANAAPVLVTNSPIYVGYSSLTATLIAPDAKEGFIMIEPSGGEPDALHIEGPMGLRTYDFNEPATITVYGVAIYEDGSSKETAHHELNVLRKTVSEGDVTSLGTFNVTAPDSSTVHWATATDLDIAISPVSNSDAILTQTNIDYTILTFDLTDGWEGSRKIIDKRYVGKDDNTGGEVLTNSNGTVSLNGLVQSGRTYFYVASANASGFGSAERTGYILTKDDAVPDPNAMLMTVNGKPNNENNSSIVTVSARQGCQFRIDFADGLGFPDELDIRIGDTAYRIEPEEWYYWRMLGHVEFDWWFNTDQNVTAYAKARWSAIPGQKMSNLLVINTEAEAREAKTLEPVTITMNSSVLRGEMLNVTITDSDKYAEFIGAHIEDADRSGFWHGVYEAKGNTIRIPTAALEPGTYLMQVVCEAEGYNSAATTKPFVVLENKDLTDPVLLVTSNAVTTHEGVMFEGYAPDAKEVVLLVLQDPDNEEENMGRWDYNGDSISQDYGWDQEGTYYGRLIAKYQNGPEKRATVTINVSADGDLTGPTITNSPVIPAVIPAGQPLTVSFTATGAEWVNAKLDDVTRGWQEQDNQDIEKLDENGAGSITFEGSNFVANRCYRIELNSNKRGMNSGHTVFQVMAYDARMIDTNKTVTLTVDGYSTAEQTLPSSKNVKVKVTAPGADMIGIWNGSDWEYWNSYEDWETRWSFGRDSILMAYAYYYDNEGNVSIGLSNSVRLTITDRGELGKPNYTTNLAASEDPEKPGKTLEQDEWLTIKIGQDPGYTLFGPESTEPDGKIDVWYYAWLEKWVDDEDEGYWDRQDNNYDWNPESREIRIPTFGKTAGKYLLTVGADAEGLKNHETSESFELTAATEPKDLYFGVDKKPEEGQTTITLLTHEALNMYLYVKDADRIQVLISKENEPGWFDYRYNNSGQWGSWEWGTGNKGTYTLTPVAYFNNYDANGNPVQDANGNWQREEIYTKEAITIKVEAKNGLLGTVKVNNLPGAIFKNDTTFNGINASIQALEHAAGYNIELHYEAEDGSSSEKLMEDEFSASENAMTYPLTFGRNLFATGEGANSPLRTGMYILRVNAWAPGYESTCTEKRMRVIEPTTDSIGLKVTVHDKDTDEDVVYDTTKDNCPTNITCLAGQHIDIDIVAPGADAIRFLNDNGDWNRKESRNFNQNGVYRESPSYDAGTYMIYAQAGYSKSGTAIDWYDPDVWQDFSMDRDLNWSAGSKVIQLTVTAEGTADAPVITDIGEVTRGSILTLSVDRIRDNSAGAMPTELEGVILREDGGETRFNFNAENLTAGDYPVSFQVPTGDMQAGTYYVRFRGRAEGYNSSETMKAFTLKEPGSVDPAVILEIPGMLYDNEDFAVSAYAPGANRMELHFLPSNGDEFSEEYTYGYIANTKRLPIGNYTIWAVAYYEGTAEGTSSTELTRKVGYRGTLKKPEIITDGVYPITGNLTFTVNGLTNVPGTRWDIQMQDQDETVQDENGVHPRDIAGWDASQGIPENGFTVTEDKLKAGHRYNIYVNVRKDGYQGNQAWAQVLVTATSDNNIVLTVKDEEGNAITDPWPRCKNFRIEIKVPPEVTAVRVMNWNTGNWENHDKAHGADIHDDGSSTFIWEDVNLYEAGNYKIVAQATTDEPEEVTDNPDAWYDVNYENLNWSMTSAPYPITVFSNGQLAAPIIDSITPKVSETTGKATIQQGGIFVVTITPDENNKDRRVWYYAKLRQEDGWESYESFSMDPVTNTISIPTMYYAQAEYQLKIAIDGEGINGNSVLIPIKITAPGEGLTVNLSKTMDLTNEELPKTTVLTHEEILWSAYDADATNISMEAWMMDDENGARQPFSSWSNEGWSDTRIAEGRLEFGGHAGTAYIKVTATHEPGETAKVYLAEVTVSAPSGNLPAPKIISGLWYAGNDLNFEVDPGTNAEWYNIEGIWKTEDYAFLYSTPGNKENRRFFNYDANDLDGSGIDIRISAAAEGYNDVTTGVILQPIDTTNVLRLPSGLTKIEAEAFNNLQNVKSVIIPDGVTFIGKDAFTECYNLRTVQMPNSSTQISIDSDAFIKENVTIYGYAGSFAETWAKQNGISFVYID